MMSKKVMKKLGVILQAKLNLIIIQVHFYKNPEIDFSYQWGN